MVWLVVQESEAEGQAMLLEEEGVSVISDVDDTLRISVVGKLSHYFKSTFLKEFEDVHGMAELYQVYASLSCAVPCGSHARNPIAGVGEHAAGSVPLRKRYAVSAVAALERIPRQQGLSQGQLPLALLPGARYVRSRPMFSSE